MADYRLTRKAIEDLSEIWSYTYSTWSAERADLYYQMLLNNCQDIAENRIICKNYQGIIKNIFGLRAGSHIIFYRRVATSQVEIVRILHNRMDLKK